MLHSLLTEVRRDFAVASGGVDGAVPPPLHATSNATTMAQFALTRDLLLELRESSEVSESAEAIGGAAQGAAGQSSTLAAGSLHPYGGRVTAATSWDDHKRGVADTLGVRLRTRVNESRPGTLLVDTGPFTAPAERLLVDVELSLGAQVRALGSATSLGAAASHLEVSAAEITTAALEDALRAGGFGARALVLLSSAIADDDGVTSVWRGARSVAPPPSAVPAKEGLVSPALAASAVALCAALCLAIALWRWPGGRRLMCCLATDSAPQAKTLSTGTGTGSALATAQLSRSPLSDHTNAAQRAPALVEARVVRSPIAAGVHSPISPEFRMRALGRRSPDESPDTAASPSRPQFSPSPCTKTPLEAAPSDERRQSPTTVDTERRERQSVEAAIGGMHAEKEGPSGRLRRRQTTSGNELAASPPVPMASPLSPPSIDGRRAVTTPRARGQGSTSPPRDVRREASPRPSADPSSQLPLQSSRGLLPKPLLAFLPPRPPRATRRRAPGTGIQQPPTACRSDARRSAEGGRAPAEGGRAPAEGGYAPAEGGRTPAEGGRAPADEVRPHHAARRKITLAVEDATGRATRSPHPEPSCPRAPADLSCSPAQAKAKGHSSGKSRASYERAPERRSPTMETPHEPGEAGNARTRGEHREAASPARAAVNSKAVAHCRCRDDAPSDTLHRTRVGDVKHRDRGTHRPRRLGLDPISDSGHALPKDNAAIKPNPRARPRAARAKPTAIPCLELDHPSAASEPSSRPGLFEAPRSVADAPTPHATVPPTASSDAREQDGISLTARIKRTLEAANGLRQKANAAHARAMNTQIAATETTSKSPEAGLERTVQIGRAVV